MSRMLSYLLRVSLGFRGVIPYRNRVLPDFRLLVAIPVFLFPSIHMVDVWLLTFK